MLIINLLGLGYNTTYYDILGIHKNSTIEQIKSAYHKKARICHPDKNINTDATEKMQQLNHAYEVLSDVFLRCEYDNTLNSNKFESNSSSEKGYDQNDFFFNQNKQPHQDKFTYEGWTAELIGSTNLFLFHPSLQGYKNNISIFNLRQNTTVALPINMNIYLQRRVKNFLFSLPINYSLWSEGQVEFLFDLPSNKILRQQILEGVFNIYKVPKEMINIIYQALQIQPINRYQNNKSFEDLFRSTAHNYKNAQFGEWELSLTAAHLFIAHPSLKGCKNNITFFNIYTSPSIALPINGDQSIKEHLVKHIEHLSNDSPLCFNDVEMVIKLPQDKKLLEKILDVVFYLYYFPEELITLIQKLAILLEESPCNNFSLFI